MQGYSLKRKDNEAAEFLFFFFFFFFFPVYKYNDSATPDTPLVSSADRKCQTILQLLQNPEAEIGDVRTVGL